jgi:hypothetical protein
MASNSYFQYFDTIVYDQDGIIQDVVNIVQHVQPADLELGNFYIFQKYQLQSGELPESLSNKLYGTTDYFWTILVINNIVNPFLDWPLSDNQVELLTTKKYGAGNEYDINHYEWTGTDSHLAGLPLDAIDTASAIAGTLPGLSSLYISYTNLAWEIVQNMKKKAIIVINPIVIANFVEAYTNALKGKL